MRARWRLSVRRLRGVVALGVAVAAASLSGGAPAHAGCRVHADFPYLGVALASVDAAGRWVGRWLGAHPLACEGETYVVAVGPDAWAALQRALADPSPSLHLAGDLPYVGDGTCLIGAERRWWTRAGSGPVEGEVWWDGAPVPAGVPTLPCPTNLPGDAPLVLRPAVP